MRYLLIIITKTFTFTAVNILTNSTFYLIYFVQAIMSWSAKNLDSHQEEITELFLNNFSTEEIASHLLSSYNVQVSIKTLKCCLADWNIKKQVKTEDSSQLWARIATLFFECCAEDNEILYILDQEGYTIGKAGLKHLQKKLELIWQISWFDQEKADEKLHEVVLQELDKELIERYEHRYLYHHFHNQMHLVSR